MACLTKLMAIELGPQGVRVNAVSPGMCDAGMSGPIYEVNPEARVVRSKGVPLRRLGLAEDISNAVMFLASDRASYINGQELLVDGGYSAIAQLPRA